MKDDDKTTVWVRDVSGDGSWHRATRTLDTSDGRVSFVVRTCDDKGVFVDTDDRDVIVNGEPVAPYAYPRCGTCDAGGDVTVSTDDGPCRNQWRWARPKGLARWHAYLICDDDPTRMARVCDIDLDEPAWVALDDPAWATVDTEYKDDRDNCPQCRSIKPWVDLFTETDGEAQDTIDELTRANEGLAAHAAAAVERHNEMLRERNDAINASALYVRERDNALRSRDLMRKARDRDAATVDALKAGVRRGIEAHTELIRLTDEVERLRTALMDRRLKHNARIDDMVRRESAALADAIEARKERDEARKEIEWLKAVTIEWPPPGFGVPFTATVDRKSSTVYGTEVRTSTAFGRVTFGNVNHSHPFHPVCGAEGCGLPNLIARAVRSHANDALATHWRNVHLKRVPVVKEGSLTVATCSITGCGERFDGVDPRHVVRSVVLHELREHPVKEGER